MRSGEQADVNAGQIQRDDRGESTDVEQLDRLRGGKTEDIEGDNRATN